MKKRILTFLLAASAAVTGAFGLSACSDADNNKTQSQWGNEYSYATAYAQAQELGYAGTLEEFIDMISGKDGTNGKDGTDGKDGTNGKNGTDGKDGTNGKNGKDGKDGKDGADGITPHIGANGNWFIGDTDTGVKAAGTDGSNGADGITPHIGANGNWFIGNTDTGVKASGTNGSTGNSNTGNTTPHIGANGNWFIGETDTGIKASGADGSDGNDGHDGTNGITPHIGANGNWFIGEVDTGIKAVGNDGNDGNDGITPHIGANGNWFIGEVDTGIKASGADGNDGHDGTTPHIGANGNWFIGEVDTGIKASGADGNDGTDGITPHIGANGNWFIGDVDTGIKAVGNDGNDGTDGITPHIGANGNWFIGNTDTGIKAVGNDGNNGKDGVGVKNAFINSNGHLIIVLTNDKQIDCGSVYGTHTHQYGSWSTVLLANCTTNGLRYRKCSICNTADFETIPAAHRIVINSAVEPTCTQPGLTEGKRCSSCGTIIVKQTEIKAKGHVWNEDGVCTVCNFYKNDVSGLLFDIVTDVPTPYAILTGIGDCEGTDITIPDTYLGYPVKRIDDYALERCNNLNSVVIPDSVIYIGEGAFSNCANLTKVTLPENLTSISDKTFYYCSALKEITLPSNLNSIGVSTFYYCSKLANIEIPSTVTEIGAGAFHGCKSFTEIEIPYGITEIKGSTFNFCESLKSVSLPESVTEIGRDAFKYCTSLNNLIIPNSVTKIGNMAFSCCQSLTSITIPGSVSIMENTVFQACEELQSVIFADGANSIGRMVFANCKSLTSVTFPVSMTDLGNLSLFSGTPLAIINYKGTMDQWRDITKTTNWNKGTNNFIIKCSDGTLDKDENELTMHNHEYTDGICTICEASHLTYELSADGLSYTVTGIADDCTDKNIIVPDYENGLPVIKISPAFQYKDKVELLQTAKIESILIGKNVNDIPVNALNIDTLKTIKVDADNAVYSSTDGNLYSKDGKTFIKYAKGKTATEFALPSKVTAIGEAAFQGAKFTSVTIGDSVTSIARLAFNGSAITAINIPENVRVISERAFYSCSKLAEINVVAKNQCYKSVDGNIYENSYSNGYYQNDNKILIQYAIGKSQTSFTLPAGVATINDYAFAGAVKLQSVIIPTTVTKIGAEAFHSCSSLKSITLPDRITYVGERAFYGCPRELFTIENNVKYIGSATNNYFAAVQIVNPEREITIDKNTRVFASGLLRFVNDAEITFSGTVTAWNSIRKCTDWNIDTGNYTIICTDGKLDKDGNEITE